MISKTPVTDYIESNRNWEDWKTEYKYGAFYIFPPEPLRTQINKLREKYDPQSQDYCDAHISLTIPLPRALYPEDIEEFRKCLSNFQKFPLIFEKPSAYPGIPGVVLRCFPENTLNQLVQRLEACTPFKDAAPRKWPFSPHMTVAEFVTLERTSQIINELVPLNLSGSFVVDEITYAAPNSVFHFSERVKIKMAV